jgi:hypothetical protein
LLKEGVLQQNKPAEYPGKAAVMRVNDILHQKNSAGLQDGLF